MLRSLEGLRDGRWEDGLTDTGKALLKAARIQIIKDAEDLLERGYFVVAEVPSNSGRLVWNGPTERVGGYRIAVGNDEITIAKDRDKMLRRRRVYRTTDGAVLPLKRFVADPEGITLRRHLRGDRNGLTIWAKELPALTEFHKEAAAMVPREIAVLGAATVRRNTTYPIFVFN